MLPPFIIEQIRQREEQKRERDRDNRRPRLQLPVERLPAPRREPGGEADDDAIDDDESSDRGVVIVELL